MKQQQKTTKLMRNDDRLMELPDGILSKIISLLSLKEAVRTSILSKSWRSLWTNYPDIIFDHINIVGRRQVQTDRFVEWVNDVLKKRCKGPKMDSVTIRFPLGQNNASHITRWINCAVSKGVENLVLDLSRHSFEVSDFCSTASERYTFPFWVFDTCRKYCKVKHLKLTSCSLGSFPTSQSLTSLLTVELRRVHVTDKQLQGFLSMFLFLERMVLFGCDGLVNIKFTNPNSRLKLLEIKVCSGLENIEIDAENLEVLQYIGQLPNFSFKHVPKLTEVFLCFTGVIKLNGVTYSLTRVAYDIPCLETLNLIWLLPTKELQLPEKVHAFSNIKQLGISIFPFKDDDNLHWISYVLKAFPLLKKLQLNLFSPFFTKQSDVRDCHLIEMTHEHLREIEINGYYGNRHEVELLKYLVGIAVDLDVLVISPSPKVYKGSDDWAYERVTKLSIEKVEQVHAVVPSNVHVKIL